MNTLDICIYSFVLQMLDLLIDLSAPFPYLGINSVIHANVFPSGLSFGFLFKPFRNLKVQSFHLWLLGFVYDLRFFLNQGYKNVIICSIFSFCTFMVLVPTFKIFIYFNFF